MSEELAFHLQGELDKCGRAANELEARLLRMIADVRAEADRCAFFGRLESERRLRAVADRGGRR